MKAIVYTHYGSPDNLRLAAVEKPVPKKNEVLVKVVASSINSWDWDLMKGSPFLVRLIGGLFKPRNQILGADIAGVVEETGSNVTDFKSGDEVFGDIAESGFGGFAEYVSVPVRLLVKKSAAMTFVQAASLPQAGLLALQGLRYKQTEIKPGEKILINGAGGGVGTLALQVAKSMGAEVTGVDREEKFEMLRSLGADHLIDYTKEDYTQTGDHYDMILDVIAHRSVADYRRALKPGGTFAMVGGSMGWLLFQMMFLGRLFRTENKKLGIMGYKPNRPDLHELMRLFEEGKMKPIIDSTWPLEETANAFRHFQSGKVQGKVVITI